MSKRLTIEDFINKSIAIHNGRFDYSKSVYINTHTKLIIICNFCNKELIMTPKNHLQGNGCYQCSRRSHIDITDRISKLKSIHNNKYTYKEIINDIVSIICVEHGEFKQSYYNHLYGHGCIKCSYIKRQVGEEEFINRCNELHLNRYDYSLVSDFRLSVSDKQVIICKIHGEFSQLLSHHFYGTGCPKCSQSKGELEIMKYLEDNNIRYLTQYKFSNCLGDKMPLKFDFYLIDLNMCIEYNGIQHYEPIECFGGLDRFNKIQRYDLIKKEYCLNSNIKLITINYDNLYILNNIITFVLNH